MIVKGVAELVKDAGPKKGKFGVQHRISIAIDGEWYSGFFKKSAEDLGLDRGSFVTFSYSENGEYKNIDVKTFECSAGADEEASPSRSKPAQAGRKGGSPGGIDRNIARGQAVNNAVTLYVNGKAGSLRDALKQAIELHAVAEHFFDKLLAGVDVGTALKAPPSAEEGEATAPTPKGKKGKEAAPKVATTKPKKATPPPPPPPEEEEPEQDEGDDNANADGFDDDIPF